MTTQEAINDLQNSINVGLSPGIESREMAIKALKTLDYTQAEIEARQVLNVMIQPRNRFKTYSAGYQGALKDIQDFIDKKMREINI